MDGDTLSTLIDELNGGASIAAPLKFQLVNAFKTSLEVLRPWMTLRASDTSKAVTTANTWQTAIDLSTITRFNSFVGMRPIRLFDGSSRIARYRQVPMEDRLEHIRVSQTFVFEESAKTLYLNGTVDFAGLLYIRHTKFSEDLTAGSAATAWPFPARFHTLLAFGAVAMHKGGVDYDERNAEQLIYNNADAMKLLKAMSQWDNGKQLAEIEEYDRGDIDGDGWRPNAINMNA